MIINTGARTDTVQYYTEWLLNRFSEGYALSHLLLGKVKPEDTIIQGAQKSFQKEAK